MIYSCNKVYKVEKQSLVFSMFTDEYIFTDFFLKYMFMNSQA